MCFRTGILLTQSRLSSFYTQKLFYTNTLMQRWFPHRNTFIQTHFLHRYFYKEVFFAQVSFTERCFYTRVLLDSDAFRQRDPYMGEGWEHSLGESSNHSGVTFPSIPALTFAHKKCLQRDALHTSALRHKYFFTEMMLQRGTFRCSHVCTQVLLHRDAF